MRISAVFAIAVLFGPAAYSQSTGELPSAPSATIQQRTQSAKPAAPAQSPSAQGTTAPTSQATPQVAESSQPAATNPSNSVNVPASASKPSSNASAEKPQDGGGLPAVNLPDSGNQPSSQPSENENADEGRTPDYSFVKTVTEVNVVFTATDKHGRFIKDLKKEDIKILDDNRPPKAIGAFSSETDLPLRVGLLVDASNSIRDRFRFEQESAVEFLNQIVRPKSDQAFVLGFDSTAEVTQDFTDSTEKLSRGVRMLRPGGGTALFDAIFYAARDKLMKVNTAGAPARKAIILLSDGEDNQSRVTREEAIEMAQRAEIIIYAISTNISGVKTRGDKVLERFAETTGGRVFFPYKLQDVANAFTDIQDELRSQYAVSYRPEDLVADGRYRAISIESLRGKNVKIRARKGYFAPKQ